MNEIVVLQHREAMTTSLKIAEVFGKRHGHVIESIANLIDDLPTDTKPSFRLSEYQDSTGRTLPMYEMNRDGFSLLAMGFTGKKALEWKVKFLSAFNKMERALLNQQNVSWQQDRLFNKAGRKDTTDVIKEFVEYATAQGSKSAKTYYMNITKMTNQALFMVKESSPKPFRDMLDSMQLSFLTSAEYVVQRALNDGMTAALHYKDIYGMARDRVQHFADQLPQQRFLKAA